MSGTVNIPFAVGSKVWWARVNTEAEWVTCPACAGTMKHSVTLGNGETCEVWCEECGAARRFDYEYGLDSHASPGKVRRYTVRAEVEEVTLASVEVRGDEINYYGEVNGSSRYIYRSEGLFATEAEAREHSETVLVPKARAEEDERFVRSFHSRFTKKNTPEKAARSAAFWQDKRRKLAEDLARVEARLARLKGAPHA